MFRLGEFSAVLASPRAGYMVLKRDVQGLFGRDIRTRGGVNSNSERTKVQIYRCLSRKSCPGTPTSGS